MPSYSTRVRLATYGSFFAFFIFGFVDNVKGPLLPAVLEDLSFSYAQGGTILFIAYLGFLLATLLTGPLSDSAGKQVIMLIAGTALVIGLSAVIAIHSFFLFATAMFFVGFGIGSIEVGANAIIVDLYEEKKGRYLNFLAFFHGFSSAVGPLFAGRLLATGHSWRIVYGLCITLPVILLLYFLVSRYPKPKPDCIDKSGRNKKWRSLFSGKLPLFYAVSTSYVAAEIGLASWLVEFLQKAKMQSLMTGSLYLSLFFAFLTAGRFFGSFLVDRIGYIRIMLYTSLCSLVIMILVTFGPTQAVFLIPLIGLFFSIIFPTNIAALSDYRTENIGTVLGLLFASAGAGGMIGPWVVGMVSNWWGIQWGFSTLLIFCLLVVVSLLCLRKNPAD